MTNFSPFHAAAQNPAGAANGQDRSVVGYMCSYAPEELIHAAGFHPMRLFSSKSDISLAENHLQAYCCSLVRGVLEESLAGRLDFLHGTVFPHTCDSVQRLSDIWRLQGRYAFFADVVLPAKLNTDSARVYMATVLEKFRAELGEAAGREITDEDIQGAIRIYNRIRTSLARIYELKTARPGIIGARDLFALVKGTMAMDRETAAQRLEEIAGGLADMDAPDNTAKRVLLSGSVCDMPDIYDLLEQSGATVVGDDLCTGQRWFDGTVPEDQPPMAALVSRYADRLICPAKHRGIHDRGQALTNRAQQVRADGVIFLLLKFCDPHAFDYPYMAEHLDNAGIRHMLMELDDQQAGLGQISTRLETFIHML